MKGIGKTFFIFKDFEIYSVEESTWKKSQHRHNFFELLYIQYGEGWHILNTNLHHYKSKDIFLLSPHDQHSMEMVEPTLFHCLRFLPTFFQKNVIEQWETLIFQHNQTNGAVELHGDTDLCQSMIHKIIEESNRPRSNEQIIRYLVRALVQVIYQYIEGQQTDSNSSPATLRIDSILHYIRTNISNSVLLRKGEIASHFHVSPTYIGEYFTKHTQLSIRDYINQTRLTLALEKLTYSHMTFGEISNDLGFTDNSHFNKFIRKNTGKSPSELRASFNTSH